MKPNAILSVAIGQVSFVFLLLLCVLILPDVHRGPGGFSNYGVYSETTLLYTLGFTAAAATTWNVGRHIKQTDIYASVLKFLFYGLSAGYIIVLLSTYPYQLNDFLNTLHRQIGMAFFVYLNVMTAWLVNDLVRSLIGVVLLFVVVLGSLFAMLSIHEYASLLSHSQAVTGIAFGILITLGTKNYIDRHGIDK